MYRSHLHVSGIRFAVVVIVALIAALALPVTAFAVDGHIKGKVVDDAYKEPLEGIAVNGYKYDSTDPTFMDWVGMTYTEADGTYDLVVPPGQIVVEFMQEPPNRYLFEFHNNTRDWASTTKLTLGSGATISGINASLGLGATISGKLLDSATGEPLEGIRVTANYDEDNNGEAFSRTDGTYEVTGLPSGTFNVLFNDIGQTDPSGESVYVTEWYNNVPTLSTATAITLTAPASRTNVNASLTKGGSITGTVTESGTGKVIYQNDGEWYNSINVSLTDVSGNELFGDTTDSKGRYFFGGVPAGTYKVKFCDWGYDALGDPGNAFYTTQWYSNKATVGTANSFTLTLSSALTGINASMVKKSTWGSISGTAYDANDTMRTIPNAEVGLYVYDGTYWNPAEVPLAYTDKLGNYRFDYVPAGTYRIRVNGYYDGETDTTYPILQGYDYQYFGGTYELDTATSVVLAGGGSVTSRNVYLPPSEGSVTMGGTLTNSLTAAAVGAGIPVDISLYDSESGWTQYVATAVTDSNGQWRWPVLSGTYKVDFNPMYGTLAPSTSYVESWYDNKPDEASADVVTTILAGPTLINDTLVPAHHFAGTVTGPSGAVEGAEVQAWKYDGLEWLPVSRDYTGVDGSYDVGGLSPGTYALSFSPPYPNPLRLATEYYDNKISLDYDAGQITLSGPGAIHTANAVLAPGVDLKGRVLLDDSAANVGQDIKVHIYYNLPGYQDGWPQIQSTYAYNFGDSAGQWWAMAQPAGSYKVAFDDPNYGYYPAIHYLNRASWAAMDLLAPAAGSAAVLEQTMDALPPVTTSDAVGGYKGDATIEFDAVDAVVGVDGTYYSVDGAAFVAGTSVTVTGEGWHTVQYYSVDNLAQTEAVRSVDFEILPPDSFAPVPIAGATRIDTAIVAAETAFPKGADTVVIATAYNWPDALGGAALAGAYDGPILLTTPSDLPATVANAITDLGATKAVILGGTAAVNDAVEDELDVLLGAANVERVSGADRYKTAEAIAAETVGILGAEYDGMAFVSTGANFPDALAASPLAAAKSWPIYLVDKNKPLQTTTRQAMQAAGVTDLAILGGTAVVPTTIETSLMSYFGTARVTRLAGSTRYETGCKVAEYGVAHAGLFWNRMALATGQNFPDALAGGVLQGRDGSVMLLTPSATLDPFVAAKLEAKRTQIEEVKYLGGLNAVTQTVRDSVQSIIE